MYPFFANHSVFLQGDAHAKLCKSALMHDTQSCTSPTQQHMYWTHHIWTKINDMQNMIIAVRQVLKGASYRMLAPGARCCTPAFACCSYGEPIRNQHGPQIVVSTDAASVASVTTFSSFPPVGSNAEPETSLHVFAKSVQDQKRSLASA